MRSAIVSATAVGVAGLGWFLHRHFAPTLTPNAAFAELSERLKELSLLGSVSGLLEWDAETVIPTAGQEIRGHHLAALAGVKHEKDTNPRIGELLTICEQALPSFSPVEAASIRLARKSYDESTRLPKELVKRLALLKSKGHICWVQARKESKFDLFAPVLQEWIDAQMEVARCLNPKKAAYDVLLDQFEPGMTSARLDEIFSQIKAGLVPLLQKIQKKVADDSSFDFNSSILVNEQFDEKSQLAAGKVVSELIGFDFQKGRMDTSVHPFSIGIHPTDVRITTRVSDNLLESMMAIIHESGHAIYEQGLNRELDCLPAASPLSFGTHESQSLFYERMIGQSGSFLSVLLPILKENFKQFPADVSNEDLFKAVNKVSPGFIRIEADELTYSLHIILRYEIEKRLFAGELKVDEIPAEWNRMVKDLLGLNVPSDSQGCLQDVHWSMGAFGYFPSYSLGAQFAARLFRSLADEMKDLDELIQSQKFQVIKNWLNEKIHKRGSLDRSLDELAVAVTGSPLDPNIFLSYLTDKYTKLYQL